MVVVLDLNTNQLYYVALRTAIGIRPYRVPSRVVFKKESYAPIDTTVLLRGEDSIQTLDFNEVSRLMRNSSQLEINVVCKLPNQDELSFPLEYCNFPEADGESYLQPICYPSIYVKNNYIYQGCPAIHLNANSEDNHLEFVAATKFNPLKEIRGEEKLKSSSRFKLKPIIKYNLFRLLNTLWPSEKYNEIIYNGHIDSVFYNVTNLNP